MSVRTTIVLFVLCVVVTAYVYVSERYTRPDWELAPDRPINVTFEGIAALTIARGSETFILRSIGDESWEIVQPLQYPAQFSTLETLVYHVKDLRIRGEGDREHLERYGLDRTSLAATLETRAGETIRLEFGNDQGGEALVYARIVHRDGKEQVVLCDAKIRNAFRDVKLSELRDNAISSINAERAGQLAITAANREIRIQREGAKWLLRTSPPGEADPADVKNVLDVLNSWTVEEFVADGPSIDLAQYGLDAPRMRVEILAQSRGSPATPPRVAIEIGAAGPPDAEGGPRTYLRHQDSPHVLLASALPLLLLERGVEEFRNHALFGYRADPPQALEFEASPDSPSSVSGLEERSGRVRREARGSWDYVVGEVHFPVDATFIETLIDNLVNLELVESFIEADRQNLQAFGFDVPRLRLRLRWQDGNSEEVVVGNELPNRRGCYYVANDHWEYFATAQLLSVDALFELPWSLRTRRVLTIAEDQIRSLFLAYEDHEGAAFERPKEAWKMEGDRLVDADGHQVLRRLTQLLAGLEAVRWEAPPADAPGPGNSSLRIRIRPVAGEFEQRDLYIGPALPGRERLVRDGPGGWVFRLQFVTSQADPFDLLAHWLRSIQR